ncbi:hypothetical protein, conserved [Angomonas deanei]|uniref:Uncharacterized protein n=1 Tax=Angomonas deanei TaxID=59799 RepID=A0A7G2CPP9_9TRYP|nr:hypothetical protein, conserved [Angomonas deanei]
MRNTVSPPNNEERNGVVFSAQASHVAPSVRTFQPRGRSLNNVKKSCINERNEKMEEILFLSVQNAVKSVTYPNVIQGKMSFDRSIAWSKTKATLPLHT